MTFCPHFDFVWSIFGGVIGCSRAFAVFAKIQFILATWTHTGAFLQDVYSHVIVRWGPQANANFFVRFTMSPIIVGPG